MAVGGFTMIEADRNRQDQWYSNQKLFEMFMEKIESLQGQQNKLILDLELTRKDLRQYNNLREQLQALQERQDSMEARCVYDMTNPDSPINKLSQKVDASLSDVKTSVDKISERMIAHEEQSRGRKSVGDGIVRWSGWIISVILFVISLITFLR